MSGRSVAATAARRPGRTLARMRSVPRSLVIATDIDTLPADRVLTRRGDCLAVRSPGNPTHWWGNFLVFDDPPGAGDGPRWEAEFDAAFAGAPGIDHRAFAWDRTDGDAGAAASELGARGYRLEHTVGLAAAPGEIRHDPRANREVQIRALDPSPGADAELWEGVIEAQLAADLASPEPIARYERFARRRQIELRELFAGGRGAWYVALDPADSRVVACCGVVATGGRGRFQQVDTVPAQRRRGICSRLVVDAAHHAAAAHELQRLVIAADAEYHALGIYESLGFRRQERVCGACRPAVAS